MWLDVLVDHITADRQRAALQTLDRMERAHPGSRGVAIGAGLVALHWHVQMHLEDLVLLPIPVVGGMGVVSKFAAVPESRRRFSRVERLLGHWVSVDHDDEAADLYTRILWHKGRRGRALTNAIDIERHHDHDGTLRYLTELTRRRLIRSSLVTAGTWLFLVVVLAVVVDTHQITQTTAVAAGLALSVVVVALLMVSGHRLVSVLPPSIARRSNGPTVSPWHRWPSSPWWS